jgi:hypothetical protein
MALRQPSEAEAKLLDHLIALAGQGLPRLEPDRAALSVETMNDGGMGSLRLFPPGTRGKARLFGRRVSSWEFDDLDGVRVLVSLVVDADERLYELELWKSDFGRLLQLPEFDGATPSE